MVEGPHVAVSVEYRGAGLDPERMLLLFQKPSRLEKDERGDTDPGLWISKGIVEAHGGRIWAESDGPGRGAKFIFTIPVLEETASHAVAAPATPMVDAQRMGTEQVRILTVDDDPQMLGYLHDVLTKAGYASAVTGDPIEALHLLEARRPHLVLLDLVLPGTDGVELLKDIRTMADVPVIFISAYGQEDVVRQGLGHGGRGLPGETLVAYGIGGEDSSGPAEQSGPGGQPSRLRPMSGKAWLWTLRRATSASQAAR